MRRLPPLLQLTRAEYDGYDPDFAAKSNRKLLWRGTTTGADFTKDSPWKKSQRARLHFMSHADSGRHELMWTNEDGRQRLLNETVPSLNRRLMDTSLSGSPAQCDPETCDWLAKNVQFARTQGLEESYTYAYMVRRCSRGGADGADGCAPTVRARH